MIKSKINISMGLKELVEERLKKELDKEFDKAIANFKKRQGEIVCGLLVNVMKSVDMRTLEDKITFTISTKE